MLVLDEHMVEAYSSIGMAIYVHVACNVSVCMPHLD